MEFLPQQAYTGVAGQTVRWQSVVPGRTGYVDFTRIMQPNEDSVAYAYRVIDAEEDTALQVALGSNDGIKLWLNGALLLENKASRTARPGDERLALPLKQGTNTVLLKIDQMGGGWGFYFAVER